VNSDGVTHHVYLRGAQALRPDLHHGVAFQERVDPKKAAKLAAPRGGPRPVKKSLPAAKAATKKKGRGSGA
jgi:hypothetical protein